MKRFLENAQWICLGLGIGSYLASNWRLAIVFGVASLVALLLQTES